MSVTFLILALACNPSPDGQALTVPPTVTDVVWTQDGVAMPLGEARAYLGEVSSATGACDSHVRLWFSAEHGGLLLDFTAYESGAAVLNPSPPSEHRRTTLYRYDLPDGPEWSGGPASLQIGPDFLHTLTLESPMRCVGDACEPSTPVTLEFTGDLEISHCNLIPEGTDMTSPTGNPYCLAGDYSTCEREDTGFAE